MTRRKSILGVLALCALSLCAFGASNASAAKGLTAVTCEKVAPETGNYSSSLCETPVVLKGEYITKAIPVGTTTEVTGEAVGVSTLKGIATGLNVQITCSKTEVSGHIKNTEPSALVHVIDGEKILIDYKECHAALQSELGKKCEVESITGTPGTKGTIATAELKSATTTEHNIKFEPTVGTTFAEFKILNGGCAIPNVTVKVTGSVIGVANTEKHGHVTFTPATNGGLLKANGNAASYEGTNNAVMKGGTTIVGAETFT